MQLAILRFKFSRHQKRMTLQTFLQNIKNRVANWQFLAELAMQCMIIEYRFAY